MSSMLQPNVPAMMNASGSDGSNLPRSIEMTV
jgi:hypothetical protein